MQNKNFFTKTRWLMAIILLFSLSISNAWGVSVAYDFSVAANNPGDAQNWFSDDIGAYASWSATKGGSNNPKYYDTGSGLRIYNGGKFTVTSTINMSSITLTFSSSSYTFSTGNTTTPQTVTLSPAAKSYEWSVSRTCRLQKVEITYASGGCDAIDVTGGSAITLPAGSTTYNTSDWLKAGAAFAYPSSATTYSIGDDAYCVSLKDVADFKDATGIRFKGGSGVLTISNIVSNYGIDVEIVASGTNNFTVSLDGAASNVTGNNTTLSISTTSTTATLTIRKNTSNQGNVTYIKITPKTASCNANPTVGAASINSSFTLTSLTGTVSVNCTGSSTGSASCSWVDRGYVWSLGTTTTTPTVDNNKVAGGNGDQATGWQGSITPSGSTTPTAWEVGKTYYIRAYGKNGKAGAAFAYGTAETFTLRSITYNSNGGSDVATQYVNSGGTYSAPTAPTKTGYTFGGWYTDNGTFANAMDWSSAITTNKELYAKWTASTYTINLNGNGATTAGTASVTATYNSATLSSSITNPEKTDYIFSGWYSGSGGTGSLVIDASGVLQENVAGYTGAGGVWTKTAGTTLYAKWTEHTYTNYRTSCCTRPTITISGTGKTVTDGKISFPVLREDLGGASSTTWAELPITISSNSSGAITIINGSMPEGGGNIDNAAKTAWKLSAWESRAESGGTITGTDHATFTNPSSGNYLFKVKTTTGYTGQGTYRIGITQAADATYCEAVVWMWIDVTLRDKFVDAVNGNAEINKDGHGAQLKTPAESDMDADLNDDCNSTTRRLIGWIKETDLQTMYGTPGETGYLEDAASYNASKVVAPYADFTTSGCTWYAVWGVDNTPEP